MMVSYDFYINSYMGSAVPEKAFAGVAARAREVLDRLCRICTVEGGETSKAMALCAMAETLYRHGNDKAGLASAAVGEVSVRYETGREQNRALQEELYRKAGIYLDIYRGRG